MLICFSFATGSPNEIADRHLGAFKGPQAFSTKTAPEITSSNYAQSHTLPASQWASPVNYGTGTATEKVKNCLD